MARPTTPPTTEVQAAAGDPTPEDSQVPGNATPVVVHRAHVGTVNAQLFVSEGTRQELLSGGRAFDYRTGRELTLDRPDDAGPDVPGTVRFKTDDEIAADLRDRARAAGVTTADVTSLNPS